jgi:shikimate dehydrogenase
MSSRADIRGTTRIAAVIGWPVAHSRSPEMLNAAFAATGIDGVLVPIAAPPGAFAGVVSALRDIGGFGASVTTPHKLSALALCDELAPEAFAIGAVNCLRVDAGRVIGHNTDGPGFADALAAAAIDARGHCTLLGAGGAARAVAHGLKLAGAGAIEVVARKPCAWTTPTSWHHVGDALGRADVVIDCTPTGLDADTERGFVDTLPLDRLRPHAVVGTLVYHRRPLLLDRAAARDHRVLDGAGMLVHQGARAFALWTGRYAPVDVMTQALAASLRDVKVS